MFLTNKPATLQDFLTSLSFIAPKGMSPDYFISPETKELPTEVNEIAQAPNNQNIRYFKKNLRDTHSFNELNTETSTLIPKPFPKKALDSEALDNRFYTTGYIKSPEIRRDSSTDMPKTSVVNEYGNFSDIMLEENYFLPKNTIIHFCKRG